MKLAEIKIYRELFAKRTAERATGGLKGWARKRSAGLLVRAVVALFAVFAAGQAFGFDLSTYAEKSKLSSGKWVKVSVSSTGMYQIPEATLRNWGLEPSKTKVYGYGARRVPDYMQLSTFADDVPQTPSEYVSGRGVYFYAEGPVTWSSRLTGYYQPVQNPFTLVGYYFLSDSDPEERLAPGTSGSEAEAGETTVFLDRLYHELERVSPGENGFLLVGEDFRLTPQQSFEFQLTDAVDGGVGRIQTSFVSKIVSGEGRVSHSINGTELSFSSADRIAANTDIHSAGLESLSRKTFEVKGSKLTVGIRFTPTGSVSSANLNYIGISYERKLKLPQSKRLQFWYDRVKVTMEGATEGMRLWDVTDPMAITAVSARIADGKASWQSSYGNTMRSYVAWDPKGTFPTPTLESNVSAQNLHGLKTPDMVIFTPAEWKNQAERLAQVHRDDEIDPLEVLVLTPQQIYNEFSSGSPDVQAFRKLMKMLYDRGNAGQGKKLRYAIFMGRPTYDPRLLTADVQALKYPMLPSWFSDSGLNENTAFTSDDPLSFLEDDSGLYQGRDYLSVAIGRLPVTSVSEARNAVDKIIAYSNKMPKTSWKNSVLVFADDQDSGQHMTQANTMADNFLSGDSGSDIFVRKLYIDQYELVGNHYPDAKTQLFRQLDEGVMLWTFQGHAAATSLTHEQVVTYQDLNSMNLRHWPVLYAATCYFLRWDSTTRSGAEILFANPNGGVIAAISATRPAYISLNGELSATMGRNLLNRDDRGYIVPIGEGYRQAKNDYRNMSGHLVSNENKLRYVLLGDPALRMALPSHRVVLESVDGKAITPLDGDDEPVTLMARQTATLKGRVVSAADGSTLSDFNGTVNATVYDAEESYTTRGNGKDGQPVSYDQQGNRLTVGTAKVTNGEFSMTVSMPAEIANNYRPGAINLYAYSTAKGKEAAGVCRQLYVYGEDYDAVPDTQAPEIEKMYLNHPSFVNGQEVNAEPVLLARVRDDRSINMSVAGVGHAMSLSLDGGEKTWGDVADYFTPLSDGSAGGDILYPLSGLKEGYHTLTLRVWDNGPNSTSADIEFFVAPYVAPTVYEVYTDKNPVDDCANFYVVHDRPDRNVTVSVEVYNLMGRMLWKQSESGRSEMFTSMPLTWDLLDTGGRRVPRGIYLYRATVTDKETGETSSTETRKLAVRGL